MNYEQWLHGICVGAFTIFDRFQAILSIIKKLYKQPVIKFVNSTWILKIININSKESNTLSENKGTNFDLSINKLYFLKFIF